MLPLFKSFPNLKDKLNHIPFAVLPTPVLELNKLASRLNISSLWMKRDDISGEDYGGNKIRKLEFLLGEAIANGAREVITFGYAGSNFATATSISAHKSGLGCISMLLKQIPAAYVRDNLLYSFINGAELHHYSNHTALGLGTLWQRWQHKLTTGRFPFYIPVGGSTPIGTIGFVNAGLELAEQIKAGLLPAPNYIYMGMGTMGTAAGLLIGLKAAGIKTKIIAACATSTREANSTKLLALAQETNTLLHKLDPAFPEIVISTEDYEIRNEYYHRSYATLTPDLTAALKLTQEFEGITLDQTYTAKAMAAIITDAAQQLLNNKSVLFWNTFNSRDFSDSISDVDYHKLPKPFYRYF